MNRTTIAWHRFGLGAKPDSRPPVDASRWLIDQITRYDPKPATIASLPDTVERVGALIEYRDAQRERRQSSGDDEDVAAAQKLRQVARQTYLADAAARASLSITSEQPFAERLVHFWSNHFAVSVAKGQTFGLAGAHEFSAIRPHITGSFRNLLRAAVLHPAMLIYLDQAQSIGPGSSGAQLARRRSDREAGINENLAREILELHTLGVGGGYVQADVTEFAKALTGWTVAGFRATRRATVMSTGAAWAEYLHEPGRRQFMGSSYAVDGANQALAIMDDLAAHPATARHVATKLARHFAADEPPAAMVARLEEAFLDSNGDLPTVYRAIIDSPEAWSTANTKFRTPWEWAIASLRAIGAREIEPRAFAGLMRELGQNVWAPTSPKGFDDIAASWAAPDALIRRVEAADRIASRAGPRDVSELARSLFPDSLNEGTAAAIRRAESGTQALALLLSAPEMMRR